jgi:methylmalonyl-CoA/ethylmalonyl-CoA epimerase
VALAVDDVVVAMEEARRNGLAVIDEHPRMGARGRKVAFIHPKSTGGVLLEFVEHPRS